MKSTRIFTFVISSTNGGQPHYITNGSVRDHSRWETRSGERQQRLENPNATENSQQTGKDPMLSKQSLGKVLTHSSTHLEGYFLGLGMLKA